MFIYACECIGLRNIVIMMYMYLAMLYPINDFNWIELNNWSAPNSRGILPVQRQRQRYQKGNKKKDRQYND